MSKAYGKLTDRQGHWKRQNLKCVLYGGTYEQCVQLEKQPKMLIVFNEIRWTGAGRIKMRKALTWCRRHSWRKTIENKRTKYEETMKTIGL